MVNADLEFENDSGLQYVPYLDLRGPNPRPARHLNYQTHIYAFEYLTRPL